MERGKRIRQMKKKKTRKKTLVIIAVVVVLFLAVRIAGCALASDPGALVTTVNASRGELQESISTNGTVESGTVRVLFSPADGKIADVMVKEGDLVEAGQLLVSFDQEEMERMLEQASLQHTSSNAGYQEILAENAKDQARLSEADTNLAVLDQQIADYTSYLKDLKAELERSQRETSNELASEQYHLTGRQAELTAQLKAMGFSETAEADESGEAPDPETVEKVQQIRKELQEIEGQLAHNSYQQSIAPNSDYIAEMQDKIADVEENLTKCQEYKAQMESQKSASEAAVLDGYGRQRYAADNDLANLTYEEAKRQYDAAAGGVTAEFAGIVTECSAVPGAQVTENMQLLTLESSEDVRVVFQASKNDVAKLALGQAADVTVSGQVYQGEVSRISHAAARNESNTPMVEVEVRLLNPDEKIILGLDAKLTIYTRKAENALILPVEAVNSDREGDFLYVAEDGIVVKKPVVCGISTDLYTEVKEGITEEDQVILTSYSALEEGMAVTVLPDQGGM